MADIVDSIFGLSSQDLINKQRERDQQFAVNVANTYQNPTDRLGALIGASLGGGLARGLFNIQDPQIKAAQDFESALAEAQQSSTNPAEAMMKLAEKLGSDPRFSRQAAMAKMKAQELMNDTQLNNAKVASELAQQRKYEAEAAKASKETGYTAVSPIGKLIQDREAQRQNLALQGIDDPTVLAQALKPFDDALTAEATKDSSTSLDKLAAQAVLTLNNPQATPEQKAQASQIYGQVFPIVAKGDLSGYTLKNPQMGPAGGVVPTPGSEQDVKAKAAEAKAKEAETRELTSLSAQAAKSANVIDTIDNAISLANSSNFTTGLTGSVLSAVPGTPAYQLQSLLPTIQASEAFTALQKMRDASPTGGALGQVAVREIELLQSDIAALDPKAGKDLLTKQLGKIKQRYTNILKIAYEKLPKTIDTIGLVPNWKNLDPKQREKILDERLRAADKAQVAGKEETYFNKTPEEIMETLYGNSSKTTYINGKVVFRPDNFNDEGWEQYKRQYGGK